MKNIIPLVVTAIALVISPCLPAAEAGDPEADLKKLVERVKQKLQKERPTPENLAPELKAFDALAKKYKGQKTDAVANIPMFKAMLHFQIFQDAETTEKILQQLLVDFPKTEVATNAEQVLEALGAQRKAMQMVAQLVPGKEFPDFKATDVNGKPASLARLKGKVVLIDFWATWCGPCVGEIPHIKAAYKKYQKKGFEVIGISGDRQKSTLEGFIKSNEIPWQQVFDDGGTINMTYGVTSIPTTYLVDGEGKIIAKNLRGHALEAALAEALN
jgi:peroxiredoxin